MKPGTKSIIRIAGLSAILLLLVPVNERSRILEKSDSSTPFGEGIIRCVIDTEDDMYGGKGLKAGFNYEMLTRFAEREMLLVRIRAARSGENLRDSLMLGAIDILVRQISDTTDNTGMHKSRNVDHYCAWYLREDRTAELKDVNIWLATFTKKREYNEIRNRFYSSYEPFKRLEQGTLSRRISPYDNLIKKYAESIGWDWRLLAAVVYQESKFSINSVSARGATGLMQILPSTAAYYGVYDLINPEENLKAGTRHLARLQKAFPENIFTEEERINFTLAAYNAGEGRISDCRAYAGSKDLDTTRWEEIVKVIPEMRKYEITLEDDSVKTGRFRGTETINYVQNIHNIYEAFCTISGEPSI